MPITAEHLTEIFPGADPAWADAMNDAFLAFAITTDNAVAAFLGIVGNETGGLVRFGGRERMNYTLERAKQVWPRVGRDEYTAAAKIRAGEQAFTNWIYAGVLGNGDEASGDGWRYRGGGIIQLTGRANYAAFFRAAGLPADTDPQLLATDRRISAMAAAWFMVKHVRMLAKMDTGDETDFLAVARRVGLPPDARATARRLHYWRLAKAVLANDDAALAPPPHAAPPNPTARVATAAAGGTGVLGYLASIVDPADVPAWIPALQSIVAFTWANWRWVAAVIGLALAVAVYYDLRRARMQRAAAKER